MEVPRNNISVKEYKINQYIVKELEIKKICYLKTTTVPIIRKALRMIKKGTESLYHFGSYLCMEKSYNELSVSAA